ncbi:MAG: envelope stress response membrane protein PspB [Alphaproteobacteria bacterium]|nr:envelope stress response membrane protein PspB [Alphaproteobacteria bacterium]
MAMSLGLVSIICIFVVLPWMFLHYFSKARNARNLTDDDERMLEDIWRSARTMERRIETLERLVEPDGITPRPRPTERTRGDIN